MHEGFAASTPAAECVLTFTTAATTAAAATAPAALLLCVPIFSAPATTPPSANSAYINQLIDPDAPPASLETLFVPAPAAAPAAPAPSFSYITCYETAHVLQGQAQGSASISHAFLQVFYFPEGLTVTDQTLTALKAAIAGTTSAQSQILPPFTLPAALRNGSDSTVYTYSYTDSGQKEVMSLSDTGELYVYTLSSASDEFRNRVEYFTKSPKIPRGRTPKTADESAATYKCVPLEEVQRTGKIPTAGGAAAGTLGDIQSQTATQKALSLQEASQKGQSTETTAAVLLGFGLGLLGLIWVGSAMTKKISNVG